MRSPCFLSIFLYLSDCLYIRLSICLYIPLNFLTYELTLLSVCVCPPNLLVFYASHLVSKESRLLVLPSNYYLLYPV
jgi:hypothetical protein